MILEVRLSACGVARLLFILINTYIIEVLLILLLGFYYLINDQRVVFSFYGYFLGTNE
jgi:hypothetical protein